MLTLNKPWCKQPQEILSVDWSNPLTVNLVAASVAEGTPIDPTVYTSVNGYTNTVGPEGREVFLTAASTQNFVNNGANLVAQFPFTVIVVARPTVAASMALFTVYSDANNWHEFWVSNGTYLRLKSASGAGNGEALSATAYTTGETVTFGGRVSSATERSVWRNGSLLNSNTTSVSPAAAISNRWGVWNSSTDRYNGAMALRLLWSRALSNAEMDSIGKNPWQLFPNVPTAFVHSNLPKRNI